MRSWRAASFGPLAAAACLALSASRPASAVDYYEAGYPDFSTLHVETVPLHVSAGQPFVLRVTVRETTYEPDPIGCTAAVYWNGTVQVSKGILDIHVSYSVCPSSSSSSADAQGMVTAVREWQVPGLAAGAYTVQFGEGVDPAYAETRLRVEAPTPQLKLRNDRFLVFVDRQDGATSVPASATALTAESGYFSFFAPSNVEVTVKVLDGRGVNGRFWLFAASMTDLPFTLAVVDTAGSCWTPPGDPRLTCPTRTYRSVAGENRNFIDTDAFED
jgi:hypothetical protein